MRSGSGHAERAYPFAFSPQSRIIFHVTRALPLLQRRQADLEDRREEDRVCGLEPSRARWSAGRRRVPIARDPRASGDESPPRCVDSSSEARGGGRIILRQTGLASPWRLPALHFAFLRNGNRDKGVPAPRTPACGALAIRQPPSFRDQEACCFAPRLVVADSRAPPNS
jgi:hypothetical protein